MQKVYVYDRCLLRLIAGHSYSNPFLDVELILELEGPGGECLKVPGYWNGGGEWCIRWMPLAEGVWRWTTVCGCAEDGGLHGVTGECLAVSRTHAEAAAHPNAKGVIRVRPGERFFEYADGTKFYWLGDTLWAAHAARFDEGTGLPLYAADRRSKGFTVVQIAAGHPAGDEGEEDVAGYAPHSRAQYLNAGGAPYSERYLKINPVYFAELDLRIEALHDAGFAICLMGMWGQELQAMGTENAIRYWKYLVARYSSYQVFWVPAGEYMFTPDVQAWREIGQAIRASDPYRHPISVHSTAPHSGSRHYQNEDWYDFNLIQTGHVLGFSRFLASLPLMDYLMSPVKPTVMSESWYEHHPNRLEEDGRRIQAADVRFASYVPLLSGCIGITYGSHGVWSVYDGAEPEAWRDNERPLRWEKELALPGSSQMTVLRTLMESVSWWELEPHPEWISAERHIHVFCAASHRNEYVIYAAGGRGRLYVFIDGGEGEHYAASWTNPRTGEETAALCLGYAPYGSGWIWRAQMPDAQDWVLMLRRAA